MNRDPLHPFALFRAVALGALTVGSLALNACGREEFVGDDCEIYEDCRCPQTGYERCCLLGSTEDNCQMSCRPCEQCSDRVERGCGVLSGSGGSGDGGSGGGGSGGGEEPVVTPPECVEDADCLPQPDPLCGTAQCIEGSCEFDVHVGPLASQLRGDCMRSDCDWVGMVIKLDDPSDYYDDGNLCTVDICIAGSPENVEQPDGAYCSQPGSGYCYQGDCVECISSKPYTHCPGLACDGVYCVTMSCEINQLCGGLCAPCVFGSACASSDDCLDGVCKNGMCAQSSCTDGEKNDGETDVDCGGPCVNRCPPGKGCKLATDCDSGVCWAGICQAPTCVDGTKNAAETEIDCGGPCAPCP